MTIFVGVFFILSSFSEALKTDSVGESLVYIPAFHAAYDRTGACRYELQSFRLAFWADRSYRVANVNITDLAGSPACETR